MPSRPADQSAADAPGSTPALSESSGGANLAGPKATDAGAGTAVPTRADRFRTESARRETARWLALALGLLAILTAVPAFLHGDKRGAPQWAQAALLLAVLQMGYAAWLAAAPDYVTLRVAMLVAGLSGFMHAMALAFVISTPVGRIVPLELEAWRRPALPWCCLQMALCGLLAYVFLRESAYWERRVKGSDE